MCNQPVCVLLPTICIDLYVVTADSILRFSMCIVTTTITVTRESFYFLRGTAREPGYRSRYSDWLWAARPRGRSSSPDRVKNFLFSTSSRPALWFTQLTIQWVSGALYSGVKRPGREADHSPPTSAEVKKTWVYTSTPSYAFMA
jgi:hypothetical protein